MTCSDNHNFLHRIQRPTRYLGREVNAVFKDPRAVALRVALLFPDLYEVGMSHLGVGLLYGILNREDHIWAERAYAPAPDLEADLRARRQVLTSLESGTPLSHFDLLGVSLQYELGYTNLLNMLDLGGVPLLAADRDGSHPVVIGGGPACFNPEPVAPFFDALVLRRRGRSYPGAGDAGCGLEGKPGQPPGVVAGPGGPGRRLRPGVVPDGLRRGRGAQGHRPPGTPE